MSGMAIPVEVFCSYAPADEPWLDILETHLALLKRQGLITTWHGRRISAGINWKEAIDAHLETASVILLLISADFFASDYCYGVEMRRALEREAEGSARILPIVLRDVDWKNAPFAHLHPLPTDAAPLASWQDQDAAFADVARRLRQMIDGVSSFPAAISPSAWQHPFLRNPTNQTISAIQSTVSAPSREYQDRTRFLIRLRTRYSDLLEQSLRRAARLSLGLAGYPEAVIPPVRLLYEPDQQPTRPLSVGTSLLQVYTDAGQELLLLGGPGAGKSTLLLELALDLVRHAEQDRTQLLPVIVPLSSWASKRQALEYWLAEQVALLYDISPRLSEYLVREEQLLPLLDGLDEMEEQTRVACIQAINAYHHVHLHPLVVASRKTEYEVAATKERLTLHSAVVVQPLTSEQVDAYLMQAGEPMKVLRLALRENPVLQELATTPLMLSILLLTYRGKAVNDLPTIASLPEQQQQIFAHYVQHMVARKGTLARFSPQDLVHWLSWLARHMRERNQTVFYLEHLQPDWLAPPHRQRYTFLGVLLPGIAIGMVASILILTINPFVSISVLLFALVILGGFLGGLLSQSTSAHRSYQAPAPNPSYQTSLRPLGACLRMSLIVALLIGLLFGLGLGPSSPLDDWLLNGSIFGVVLGLSSFLLCTWLPLRTPRHASSPQNTGRAWKRLVYLLRTIHGQRALLIAVLVGIGYGLCTGLRAGLFYGLITARFDGLRAGLSIGLSMGVNVGLMVALPVGLSFGLVGLLLSLILERQSERIQLIERLHWTWRSLARGLFKPKHVKETLLVASITGLTAGLSEGLLVGPTFGVSVVLSAGLRTALGTGLSVGLSYWTLLGLFQGIERWWIEDRSRQITNQGIRSSLRNSIILGLTSVGVIGIIGILSIGLGGTPSYGLSIGLIDELSMRLSYGLSYGWLAGVSGGLLMCVISGGLSTLRHYIIRLLLARSHTFPWRAPQFLEEATTRILLRRVGGGYSFPHRLLLDYFADLPQKTL